MQDISKKIIASAVLLSSFLVAPIFVSADNSDTLKSRIEEKSRELEIINSQISSTQSKLDEVSSQSKSLSREVSSTEYSIRNLELNIRSSEVNIEKLTLELENLGVKLSDTEEMIGKKKKDIALIIRSIDQKEKVGILETLLSSNSLSDSVTEISGLVDLQSSLSDEVISLRNLSTFIGENINESNSKKTSLQSEQLNLKSRKVIVEDQKVYKETLLKETKNQESLYQKQLSALEEKQKDISGEIEDLEESLRGQYDTNLLPTKGTSVLIVPVPKGSRLTQAYGYTAFAKTAYKTGFHNGMDWGIPTGTTIRAAANGKVVAAGNNGKYQYGKYVLIEHENNLVTLYAHLSRQVVSSGQRVSAGEVIGYSGSTGYSTGPHLHFGVYSEPSYCRESRVSTQCVQLKNFGAAGLVPVGVTINPADYF
jgi:murein DD-endopeptidase MepM/ murein hydrolase activator NlpD